MRKVLMALVMLVACVGAVHGEGIVPSVVGVHLISRHAEDGKTAPGALGWNNHNPGVYARWDNGFTLGHYKNSLFRPSTYAGFTFSDKEDILSVTVGVVSGYDKLTDGKADHVSYRCEATCRDVKLKNVLTPLLVPSIRIPVTEKTSFRVSLLVPPGQPIAAHLSIEAKF